MRVMWKTHSRSCPTKVHYGEGIMDEAGFDNAATLQNVLVSRQRQTLQFCVAASTGGNRHCQIAPGLAS